MMNRKEIEAIIIEEMIYLYTKEGNAVNVPTKMIERGIRLSMPSWQVVAERLSLKLEEKLLNIAT